MSSVETGQMSAVPESSGFAWACSGMRYTRRGLARRKDSEEVERGLESEGASPAPHPSFVVFVV